MWRSTFGCPVTSVFFWPGVLEEALYRPTLQKNASWRPFSYGKTSLPDHEIRWQRLARDAKTICGKRQVQRDRLHDDAESLEEQS